MFLRNPGKVFILVIFKSFFPRDEAEDLSSWLHFSIVKWAAFTIFIRLSQGQSIGL